MTPLLPHVTGCEDMDNMVIIFDSQNKLFATDFIPFVFNKANIIIISNILGILRLDSVIEEPFHLMLDDH